MIDVSALGSRSAEFPAPISPPSGAFRAPQLCSVQSLALGGKEGALTTHRLQAALESSRSFPATSTDPLEQGQLSKQRDTCAGKARATRDIPGSRGGSLNLPFSFDLHLSSLCCSASPHVCSFPSLISLFSPEPDLCPTLELLPGAFKGI